MKQDEELPLIRAWYEMTIWLIPKIQKFPRDLRFVLGEKIEQLLFGILDLLIQAKYTRQRTSLLDTVNVELEKLRFHLRIAHDLNALSHKAYGLSSGRLLDIGGQVGGWKRATQSKQSL
tara:strand:- start:7775 stop:8131 length:357 start_codon:yes stop_codon:yes gene_type:complete